VPWFSLGKLQAWKRWLRQRRQEIGCVLVGKEWCSVVEEFCKLCLRWSWQPPASWCSLENLLPQPPALLGRAVSVKKQLLFIGEVTLGAFMLTQIVLRVVMKHVGV